uniref:Uncharacterized protein n=1 Tax=Panagrolaimus superbus TaxID=310955 RepID=A0A914Y3B3_9BILA
MYFLGLQIKRNHPASTSHNQPESDDDDSDIEVAVVSRKPKRRSDANNAKLIPKKKKSLSSNVHDDDESVNIDELSDEASAHDNSDDKPVRSLPQKETTLSHPKKDKEELYERRLSLPNEDIILNAHDDFEFVKPKKYGKPQLYIFIPDNKEFCYKFTRVQDGSSRYRCLGCFAKSRKINVRTDEDKQLYVTLSKYRSGEYFVRMGTKIHCCEPIKYESQKYQGKEMYDCYEYFYYRKIERPASLNLAIPHPENKEFCYKFFYLPSKSHYQCIDCDRQKKKLTMVRRTDCEEDDIYA